MSLKKFKFKYLDRPKYSWMKNSHLFNIIKDDFITEEELNEELPYDFCSEDCKDINNYINVIRQWEVESFPRSFFLLLSKTLPIKQIEEILEQGEDPKIMLIYDFCLQYESDNSELISRSIYEERLDFLSFLLESFDKQYTIYLCLKAARNKSKKVLEFLYNNCSSKPKQVVGEICDNAAINNSVECLQYIHKKGIKLNKSLITLCINNGSYECLVYIYENGVKFDEFNNAVRLDTPEKFRCMRYFEKRKGTRFTK